MHLHVYLQICIDIAVFRALHLDTGHHRAGFLALLWARFTLVSFGRVHLCFLNRHQSEPSASRIELIPNPDNACSPDWSPFKSFPTACSPNSCNIVQVAVVQRIQRIPTFSHLKQVPQVSGQRLWGQMHGTAYAACRSTLAYCLIACGQKDKGGQHALGTTAGTNLGNVILLQ